MRATTKAKASKKAKKVVRVEIQLEPAEVGKLDVLAHADGRTRSGWVKQLVRRALMEEG